MSYPHSSKRLRGRAGGKYHWWLCVGGWQAKYSVDVVGTVINADLVQTLLGADLVDAFCLKIFPLTLGSGKRLLADGTIPAAFKLTESKSPQAAIIVNYKCGGSVKAG